MGEDVDWNMLGATGGFIDERGSAGIDAFTPIINPPEVAILGAGRVTDQPVPDGPG